MSVSGNSWRPRQSNPGECDIYSTSLQLASRQVHTFSVLVADVSVIFSEPSKTVLHIQTYLLVTAQQCTTWEYCTVKRNVANFNTTLGSKQTSPTSSMKLAKVDRRGPIATSLHNITVLIILQEHGLLLITVVPAIVNS
jgi:hypothetical protein